jgi:type I restriction enzyme S subunit
MPPEWKKIKWGDLASLEYGKALRTYKKCKGKYPVYGTNGLIGWHDQPLCNHDGVIIGRKGAYRGVHYSRLPFFVIDTAFYLKPKVEDLDMRFAYYELLTHDINSMDSGSAIPSTSRSEFYSLEVKLPPFHEQQAIAQTLAALDDKIELNQQINKTLEAIGQAIFKRWFFDFEFPNEEGKPYKSSGGKMVYNEVLDEEVPAGWQVKPIDETADFLNGLALQKFPARDGEEYLPVIKIRELRRGVTESSDKANLDVPKEYIVIDGDILFSWSGSLEVVMWGFGKGALNQHLFKVTSSQYPKWFVYYWVVHYLPEYRQIAAGKATTMGHIQRHHLTASQVTIPDSKTLERMDRILAPVLERISRIKVETRILSEIRDSLLPKLMSGKIRVPILKEKAEDHNV